MDAATDEIGVIAARYLREPGLAGLHRIDAHIREARAESRWDDVSKWHRVRLRLIRLEGQRCLRQMSSAA